MAVETDPFFTTLKFQKPFLYGYYKLDWCKTEKSVELEHISLINKLRIRAIVIAWFQNSVERKWKWTLSHVQDHCYLHAVDMKCNYHIRIPTALSTDLDYSHVHVGLVWFGLAWTFDYFANCLYSVHSTKDIGPKIDIRDFRTLRDWWIWHFWLASN